MLRLRGPKFRGELFIGGPTLLLSLIRGRPLAARGGTFRWDDGAGGGALSSLIPKEVFLLDIIPGPLSARFD